MNKRGMGVWPIVMWAVLLLVIAIVTVAYLDQSGSADVYLEGFPDGVKSFLAAAGSVIVPVGKLIFLIVAPAGESENVQVIAFSIFLLLVLIGNETLGSFFTNKVLAFLVSAIIGIIAARSLTATVLEQTALAASPIATVSLLLGFIPIFALTKKINKWTTKPYSKMVIFTVAGLVYVFIFHFAFHALTLGIIYGVGIILLGATEMILPYYQKQKKMRDARTTGETMADIRETEVEAHAMGEGYRREDRS